MAVVALVARLNLAATFALSAGTKLVEHRAFARSLSDFRVPSVGLLSVAVPAVEATLAATLAALPATAAPAWAALGVLVVFTAMVLRNLGAGVAVPCPCFDARGQRPVSAATVVRNGVLMALAVVATGDTGGASPGATIVATVVTLPVTLLALRRFG